MRLRDRLRRRRPPALVAGDEVSDPLVEHPASTTDPALGIGSLVYRMLTNGSVSPEALEKIGFSPAGLDALLHAFEVFDPVEEPDELVAALEVAAALRRYDEELAFIAGERGVRSGTDAYRELRSEIAAYAEENDLVDLPEAYRRMLVACPERLPGSR